MKDEQGFTLIEVVVSLALVGVMATSFLYAVADNSPHGSGSASFPLGNGALGGSRWPQGGCR